MVFLIGGTAFAAGFVTALTGALATGFTTGLLTCLATGFATVLATGFATGFTVALTIAFGAGAIFFAATTGLAATFATGFAGVVLAAGFLVVDIFKDFQIKKFELKRPSEMIHISRRLLRTKYWPIN